MKTLTAHHNPGNANKTADQVPDCIEQVTLFNVQWSNCPVEVEEEVSKLWQNLELGNDNCFARYSRENFNAEEYPTLVEYLDSRGVTECLIHWWW